MRRNDVLWEHRLLQGAAREIARLRAERDALRERLAIYAKVAATWQQSAAELALRAPEPPSRETGDDHAHVE